MKDVVLKRSSEGGGGSQRAEEGLRGRRRFSEGGGGSQRAEEVLRGRRRFSGVSRGSRRQKLSLRLTAILKVAPLEEVPPAVVGPNLKSQS
uniref:Uncharacterized protein n=1 Tax=Knipowitschia caucasica TaxID=637954 RepID=A0AAV2KH44_KNICA